MTAFQRQRSETRAASLRTRTQLDMFAGDTGDDVAAEAEQAQFRRTEYGTVHALMADLLLPGGLWIEPCAGDGAIVEHVERARASLGQTPITAWHAVELRDEPDLRSIASLRIQVHDGQDFTAWSPPDKRDVTAASVVITNLPWYGWEPIVSHAFALFPYAHVVGLTCTREAMDGSGVYSHDEIAHGWHCEYCAQVAAPCHDVRDRAEWALRHAPDIRRCHGRQPLASMRGGTPTNGYPHPVEWWHWPPGQRMRREGKWRMLARYGNPNDSRATGHAVRR